MLNALNYNVNYLAVMCICLPPFSVTVPFCDCGLSKNPSYTTKLFICGMVRSKPVAIIRKILILIVALFFVATTQWSTYRSACDKKRPISQTAYRLPFFVEPNSPAPTCARTMLCPDRLVDVIHECKNPERTVRPPILFHHFHRTRTNFLFRFSADPLHNRCNSTRNRKKNHYYLLWAKHVNDCHARSVIESRIVAVWNNYSCLLAARVKWQEENDFGGGNSMSPRRRNKKWFAKTTNNETCMSR